VKESPRAAEVRGVSESRDAPYRIVRARDDLRRNSMTIALWTRSGESLSQKSACKEYGLDESEAIDAIRSGKLQYKINYAHGNPYYKLLRKEVRSLAIELRGLGC